MRLFFLLFACICNLSTAEDKAPPSLVDLSHSPIPRVAGSVNLVSGNYVDQTVHHVTSGVDPYRVGTSYVSSSDSRDLFHDDCCGPSPHAWGKLALLCPSSISTRTIPTRAGKTLEWIVGLHNSTDHPHTRGENIIVFI